MIPRRYSTAVLSALFVLMSAACSYGIIGEGYFGPDALPPYGIITDPPSLTLPGSKTKKIEQPKDPDPGPKGGDEHGGQGKQGGKKRPLSKKHEKYSTDTGKVIRSYGLGGEKTENLLERHHWAESGVGRQEKCDRYVNILHEHPYDYLAAYRASVLEYEMTGYRDAMHWLEECLKICPDYMLARNFRKKIAGGLKR